MSRNLPILTNRAARRLFLDRHALAERPVGTAKGDDLLALIERLGFVQVDSINTVERAHHMILFARRQAYRPEHLSRLHDQDRKLFEHWTHDASIIPSSFFPHWRLRFGRDETRLRERWAKWHGQGFDARFDEVLAHVAENGPVSTSEVGESEARSSGGWWDWNPSKIALEYLWRVGRLSVVRRDAFRKIYDLTERVIPDEYLCHAPSQSQTIDWACNAALDRLGFATSGEIAAFFAKVTPDEAKDWCAAAVKRGSIIEVGIECAGGQVRRSFARSDVVDGAEVPEPPGRIRILSPFDPALRDRNRAERLFGFHYRIEVFVPEAKRKYGYYVFPVLEGDRIIGRIDMKADRQADRLAVRAFWPEPGVSMGAGRRARLEAELDRMARFAQVSRADYAAGWLRETLG
ncbi:winged helix DNA-binding domain-containing protein [Defluviimonas sp. WL0002]|uniref:Winged helix DNA-binding domain-containing protein n=1 Tax=Albidovulum marisflavi TaxID=2984159 RepID=A0ABT2Z792_9RHOB|nr:crosslink repair DNA glycosylase YcaQ family protein [Defluviimonas sp. WL0002]MCV2867012.1 winged helix DNA-binding domain-containing protein [Defluviimonas sp. WL0002]